MSQESMTENSAYIPLSELRELTTLTRSQITRLEALNTDGTGFLKAEDILQVLENDHKKESQKIFFNKLILLLMVSGVILIGALCGITYGIVATTNELTVNNDDHVLKTTTNGDIAGLGAVVSTESAESISSSMEPWGITRLNFVKDGTGEYGYISINGIQVSDDGRTIVRTVLGDEFIVDESGGLVAYNETNGRKLLFWNDIVSVYDSFVETVVEPIGKEINEVVGDIFGITLDELLSGIQKAHNDANKVTVEALMDILNFISPKMASCLANFKASNLDCFTFLPCFDFMRQTLETSLNDCRTASNRQYCMQNAIQGLMDINKNSILNFLGAIAPAIRKCIVGDVNACMNTFSCLSQGRKLL